MLGAFAVHFGFGTTIGRMYVASADERGMVGVSFNEDVFKVEF
jgi:hypothetical protein